MTISHENSVDYCHSPVEKQIQICAKLSSFCFEILSYQEKKKLKSKKNVGWQCSSTCIAGVSKPTSLTDWHCCERGEDDKARERAMFHTYRITPREGGPASSEEPQTNVSCHRSKHQGDWDYVDFSGDQRYRAGQPSWHSPHHLQPYHHSEPSLWVRRDVDMLLAWGTWLRVQRSPSWQPLPASLPGGWEHRCLGGGRWCQWHLSHHV